MYIKDNLLKKIDKILFIIFLALGIVAFVGAILLIQLENEQEQSEEQQQESIYDWENGLSDNTSWLPENCKIYSKVPEVTFSDEQGTLHSISEFEGKPLVVVFWASWCSDCQEQMPQMKDYIELAKQYGEIQFLFINKTDGEKETKESALAYFEELGIKEPLYFDNGFEAYDKLGIHNIPTTMFLDQDGVITAWSPKQITKATKFDALLSKSLYGGSYATAKFITSQLMNEEGGIHSLYGENKSTTYSSDILSESEGAMLKYAVLSKNQELFERIVTYMNHDLWKDGLTAWQVSAGKASKVNALIDDLRIYNALDQAQSIWGGYEAILENDQIKLLTYGIKEEKFVDFYNADSKEYANRFTLCYGDLKTMKRLAQENSDFEDAYQTCKEVVLKGQISETFPLFYSWYNYKNGKYAKDDLNTAEAMITLLHLAEVDLLPDNALDWLKSQMVNSGVKARYTVSGKVADGYGYDSTAVYAIIAMIGREEGDTMLVNQAVRKMEKMRIDDTSLDYNGAFGLEDGSEISSFDQVMPLLAYMKIYGK